VTAPHRPQIVLPNRGGPVLRHPALVTITFAGDPRRERLEEHARWIVDSSRLTTVGAEYGVGRGTVAGTVVLPDAAPAATTNAEIEAMLARGIGDGSIPTPPDGPGWRATTAATR
jgi:hypothetical protein